MALTQITWKQTPHVFVVSAIELILNTSSPGDGNRTIKKGSFQADTQKSPMIKGNSTDGEKNEPRVI